MVVPDVGGGFGAKVGIDRDALIVAWAARKTGRALRWTETRSENLVGMTQGRAQLQHVKIGGNRDGHILAYRIDVIQDTGAYPRMGGFLPFLTCLMAPGVYDIPEVQTGFRVGGHQRHADQRLPRRRPAGSHGGHRARGRPVRRRDRHGPGRGPPAQLHRARQVPVPDQDRRHVRHRPVRRGAGQGAGRGGLRRAPRGAGSAGGPAATSGSSASACPPTWRSPRPTPAAGETGQARGARTTAPRPSTPEARRTARGTTPRGPCSCRTSSASRWTRSRSSTATPT